ncbi:MAG: HAMP domain-containing histidine kinase [Lachnospiraceae bacterium]|nr:HAMP domain-containing histidine kinase [Lachnospiraceae bacterium]
MFRKAHWLFTILCGGSTAAITIIMSLFYLRVSEKSLYDNQFQSFQNDISTITASLEQSTSVSMQWLARIEAQNGYTIYIVDNGAPFLYNSLRGSIDSSGQILLAESLYAYDSIFMIENLDPEGNSYSGIWHTEYEFTSPSTGDTYYASLIDIERNRTLSQIVILSSMASLRVSIVRQRILFVLIDLCAIIALFTFSWFFTGKLLKPLQENHEKQLQFVAAASHELRTPLSVILASNECCQSATDEERIGFSQTIRKEGKRMNHLIDDMLTLAHSGMNRFQIERKAVELDTLCLNAYEAFEPLCEQKSIELSLSLPDAPLARCHCDSDRIAQVLSILLHNALSYTPQDGSIKLSLIYHKERKTYFEITVSDTGIGISDKEKQHIFDRFYRAEKSRSTKGHFGLGLAIAYEIVTGHHGKISVHDNPPNGSIFVVRLPE